MAMFTLLFFLLVYAMAKGMDAALAGYLLAIANGSSFSGCVIPGILADKLGRFNILFASAVASGIITLCWTKCETNATIIVFAVLFGFCSGAIVSGASVTLASCPKDPQSIGTYMGMGLFVASLAALISPAINGVLAKRDNGALDMSILSGIFAASGFWLCAVGQGV